MLVTLHYPIDLLLHQLYRVFGEWGTGFLPQFFGLPNVEHFMKLFVPLFQNVVFTGTVRDFGISVGSPSPLPILLPPQHHPSQTVQPLTNFILPLLQLCLDILRSFCLGSWWGVGVLLANYEGFLHTIPTLQIVLLMQQDLLHIYGTVVLLTLGYHPLVLGSRLSLLELLLLS